MISVEIHGCPLVLEAGWLAVGLRCAWICTREHSTVVQNGLWRFPGPLGAPWSPRLTSQRSKGWPYRDISSLPTIPGSASSGNNSMNISLVAGAKKYALLMSCTINRLGYFLLCLLAHREIKYLMNSRGGVAANSSERLSVLISFATILDLYLGCNPSPLFMSTHLSLIGGRPVA